MIATASIRTLLRRSLIFGGAAFICCVGVFAGAWFAYPLPTNMLDAGPGGTLAINRGGEVMLDVTASDEQRRLPLPLSAMGEWVPNAVIAAEDEAFHNHFGVDPSAVLGAIRENLRAGRIVRGASTITMQVAGLKLNHPRTFKGKAVEAFRSFQIEHEYTKEEILESWLNAAPFGGNIVGIEAASHAYFGKPAAECSLSESALLVALPNSPERLRPDRNPTAAVQRRDVILGRMAAQGFISHREYIDALNEVVVVRPKDGAANDSHAGWMAREKGRGMPVVPLTIEPTIQSLVEEHVKHHASTLPADLDIAVIVVDLETSVVEALVGSSDASDPKDGQVNGATARRSPGSALKPFIYAAAFESHRLAPDSLVDDQSLEIAGWTPGNIDKTYLGPLPASEALRLSRNTPAIRIARDLGMGLVSSTLRRCGITYDKHAIDRAGLAAVVGGLETTPWSLAEAYATLARGGIHAPLRLVEDDPMTPSRVLSEATCAAIEQSLAGAPTDVSPALPFLAAKTGTSSGYRDAIAAGWNRTHAAVVWVGRFDGGSNSVLLGAETALPLLRSVLLAPELATFRSPRPIEPWVVARQVGRAKAQPVRILEPRDGDVLVGLEGVYRVRPQIRSLTDKAVLYVDGAPITAQHIDLLPGRHEFRLVELGESPHAITVEVVRDRS